MRRTTLGTMNIGNKGRLPQKEKNNAVRPRSSLGVGGRLSTGSRSTSLPRPKTSFGSSRRSSQYGKDPYSQLKDPRPLSDKCISTIYSIGPCVATVEQAYQNKEIRDIIQFLSMHEYPHQISQKSLSIPSSKDFFKVFVFIYSFINPNETFKKLTERRPEEEVPKIFKSLGYPFTIHKTSLSSVGSPHTWPILLAALHWMMCLVRFALTVSEDVDQYLFPSEVDGEEISGDAQMAAYFEYLEKTYKVFLQGVELENLGEYTDAFLESIQSQHAATRSEVEEIAQENKRLEEELKALQNDPSKLEALIEKRDTLQTDRSKFEAYIADLRRHRVKLDERLIQSEEALNTAKLEQEATAGEKMRLQKILSNQELSAADVQRMKKENQELKKTLTKVEQQGDALDQECWEMEMSYAKLREQTLLLSQEYNDRARKLKLIPSTAENAAGTDYELKCQHGRVTVDFKNFIKPNLLRFKQQISECSRQCQSELFTLKEKHDEIQEQISEKDEEIRALEAHITSVENDCQWKKDMYEKQHKKLTTKAEELQEEIHKMRLQSQVGIGEKQQELDEIKERFKKRTAEIEKERKQYELFIRTVCEVVIDHKTQIQTRVATIEKEAEEYHSFIQSLPEVTSELLTEEIIENLLNDKTEDNIAEGNV